MADHEVTGERPELALVEPHLAVDPRDPEHLVAGVIVAAPDRSEGPWHCAALASFDGGRTWDRQDLDVDRCIDPWVAFTDAGLALLGLIEIRDDAEGDARFRLLLFRSTDGGRTWAEPIDLGRGFEHPTLVTGPAGESFMPAVALSEPSCPDNPANGTVAEAWAMGGDYDSLAAGPDGTFHALWADARSGPFRLRHASFRIKR